MEKKTKNILIFAIIFAGFFLRVFFVDKTIIGDILVNAEWGQALIQSGANEQYYRNDWYYTPPVYPPFSQLVFGGAFYLYDHKYILSQMHNLIKFPPAFFIIYFYKWGYYLLLKLPAILADLGLGLIIHKVIFKLTGSIKRSLLGMAVYIFNPVTVFLSGIWGQTDSLVALFGITSFMLLNTGNVFLSLPLFFLGIYFKPSWAIFAPVYLFLLIVRKSNIRSVIFGILTSLALFIAISAPFAKDSVTTFTWELFTQKIPLPIGILGKASNSAFNFYTMIFRIDIDPAPKIAGLVAYLILNLAAFGALKRQKNTLLGLFTGLFLIGIGSFLFMTSMLERYFFPGLVPLIVLMFARPKLLIGLAIMNIIFFVNIAWSFYRRTSDEIGRPFVVNNFFLIRILSFIQVAIYLRVLKMIQFKRG